MGLTIHFVRHGETTASRDHIFCGAGDCQLSAQGHEMAELVAARCLNSGDWRAIYCSPQTRARETAGPTADRLGLPIIVEDGLREIAHGVWEGMTVDEARALDPEAYATWDEHPGLTAAPQGESGYDVAARALPVVGRIRSVHTEGDVLVVSHKATIRVLVCALLGVDIDHYRSRVAQPVGTFTSIEFTPRGPLLHRLADASHLPAALRSVGGI
ncbi:MAG: histidine phosphatase family protein [Thermoleophilia bacterium]